MSRFVVVKVEKKRKRRSVVFSAPSGLDISYIGDDVAFQSVLVNGKTVGAVPAAINKIDKIPFIIETDRGEETAYVEVHVGWLSLRAFRIVVGSEVVYTEGEFDLPASSTSNVEPKDYSVLDRKESKFQIVFALCLAVILCFYFPNMLILTEEWGAWKLVTKYLAPPVALSVLFVMALPQKLPAPFRKFLRGTSELLPPSQKFVVRYVLPVFWAMIFMFLATGAVLALNTRLKPGEATLLFGDVEKVRERENSSIVTIKWENRDVGIPLNICIARSIESGDKIEVAMMRGALGIFYYPRDASERSQLNTFFLENIKDGKMAREFHVKDALETHDLTWLKRVSSRWKEACESGVGSSCRLYSYYLNQAQSPESTAYLKRACDGNDPTGCSSWASAEGVAEADKKLAGARLFELCKESPTICRCYWSSIQELIAPEIVRSRQSELCSTGQRWACD